MLCLCMNYLSIETPLGKLTIAEDDGFVRNIYFEGEKPTDSRVDSDTEPSPILQLAKEQLKEYFNGKRKVFDVPIKPIGGAFHVHVWETMMERVPFGSVITYSDLATLAGNPKASRAVGMANNRNPIPIIIPCHRVVGKGGNLTGFRWGLDVKTKLLAFESRT